MSGEYLGFGDYCYIEQKRYGVKSETYKYKVISGGRANYYRQVPVDTTAPHNERGELCGIVKVIKCGVDETKVETFRVEDLTPTVDRAVVDMAAGWKHLGESANVKNEAAINKINQLCWERIGNGDFHVRCDEIISIISESIEE